MISAHVAVAVIAVGCLLPLATVRAQDAPPFTMGNEYSVDITMTAKTGLNIETHAYRAGDKRRSEMERDGVSTATIVRKDTKKLYHIIESQKVVMESNYDPSKAPSNSPAIFGPVGKFELVGPDTVNGVVTTKYKVISSDGKVNYFWLDPATKSPVQMTSSNGAMTIQWKNYKPGPQNPALFEPPANYQIINAPTSGG